MSQKEKNIALAILDNVGYSSNIEEVFNCMTRVRVKIRDFDQVDQKAIEEVDGVLGVVRDGNMLQIVVGPGVAERVANRLADISNINHSGAVSENLDPELKGSKEQTGGFRAFSATIANIFVPLIPGFVGAGLIGGIASIFQNSVTAGKLDANTWNQFITVLNVIKNGLYGYLNIYVGINAAKQFNATEVLGGVIAGIVYLAGMSPDNPIPNLFTGGNLSAGQGGIIGVIFAVYVFSKLERWLKKRVPDSIDIIVTPTVSILVVGLLTIYVIMPVAGFVSNALVSTVNRVLDVGGWFAGFVLASTFLPLVMFGLHQILTPIHVEMIEATGMTQLLPVLAMAGAGQVGAALAVWVKCRKNKRLTEVVKGSLPVGILGIGEPLIYGVTLPLGRAFITACIGGGIGGAIIGGIGGIGATAIGASGVALIPLIADGKWWGYVAGLLGAYIGGFIATYLFGIPEEATEPIN